MNVLYALCDAYETCPSSIITMLTSNSIHQPTYGSNKWVKSLADRYEIRLIDYEYIYLFTHVANVELDTDLNRNGSKRRKTTIKFVPVSNEWSSPCEWIYIFAVDGRIVKIGGTRTGLSKRSASYLCGHHTKERGKSGYCSSTNAFIYNTLEYYLRQGSTVTMFAYKLPVQTVRVDILGHMEDVVAQTYHAYESKFLSHYCNTIGHTPALSDNCDPCYK
jgi:hypothetical protein